MLRIWVWQVVTLLTAGLASRALAARGRLNRLTLAAVLGITGGLLFAIPALITHDDSWRVLALPMVLMCVGVGLLGRGGFSQTPPVTSQPDSGLFYRLFPRPRSRIESVAQAVSIALALLAAFEVEAHFGQQGAVGRSFGIVLAGVYFLTYWLLMQVAYGLIRAVAFGARRFKDPDRRL